MDADSRRRSFDHLRYAALFESGRRSAVGGVADRRLRGGVRNDDDRPLVPFARIAKASTGHGLSERLQSCFFQRILAKCVKAEARVS